MNKTIPKYHAAALILAARLNNTPKHVLYRQLYQYATQQKHLGNEQAYHEVMFIYWATIKTA